MAAFEGARQAGGGRWRREMASSAKRGYERPTWVRFLLDLLLVRRQSELKAPS